MLSNTIANAVSATAYPGRSIIIGMNPDGDKAVIAYFIMGRSVNSRNRVFVEEGSGIRTQAYDPSQLSDPSLVIYAPVRVLGDDTIVTNGDQTDTIYDYLAAGKTFEDALRTREYEPDGPHYTPRISGIVRRKKGAFSYTLSILKSLDGAPVMCVRNFFEYEKPVPGVGHFIHTYQCDGNPLPSFEGDPEKVRIPNCIDELTQDIWNHLDADNKVSLFVRYIDLSTGATDTRIVNKNA